MIESLSEIYRWVKIAAQTESLDAEIAEDWESWVARPCVETILAPRQARAILEVVGYFANHGVRTEEIIRELVRLPRFKRIIGGELE